LSGRCSSARPVVVVTGASRGLGRGCALAFGAQGAEVIVVARNHYELESVAEEIRRQGKPYGLYFEEVSSGYTTTGRQGLQAFTVVPLVVYRVFPDRRPDEDPQRAQLPLGLWVRRGVDGGCRG